MDELDFGRSLNKPSRFSKKAIAATFVTIAAAISGGVWLLQREGVGGTLTPDQRATFNLKINGIRNGVDLLPLAENAVVFSGPGCASVDKLTGIHVAPAVQSCAPGETPLRGRVQVDRQLLTEIEKNAAAATITK
jgi:hypothetical protein